MHFWPISDWFDLFIDLPPLVVSGEFVAQFKFTVLLMANGPHRITSGPCEPELYKSEHEVQDAELRVRVSARAENCTRKIPRAKCSCRMPSAGLQFPSWLAVLSCFKQWIPEHKWSQQHFRQTLTYAYIIYPLRKTSYFILLSHLVVKHTFVYVCLSKNCPCPGGPGPRKVLQHMNGVSIS